MGPRNRKKRGAVEIVEEDDILNQFLLDVPETNTPAKKPIRVASRLPPGVTNKLKAQNDLTGNNKKARIEDEPILDKLPATDDIFDDEPMIFEDMATQESAEPEEEISPHLSEVLRDSVEFLPHSNGKEFCRFYWYDMYEDQNKYPGSVYFFGRIPVNKTKFVSGCVVLKNVKRLCYLLIASDSTYEEAVAEFKAIYAKSLKLKDFTCEKVTKKYAFSSDPKIPSLADYVKLEYSCQQPALPENLKGECFTHIMNVNQTPMERTIIEMKLRGPCWLKLVDPSEPIGGKATHTRIELVVNSPQCIEVEENPEPLGKPYFCAFALSLRIYTNPDGQGNEIIAIAGMTNTCIRLDECLNRNNKASGHFIFMAKPRLSNKNLRLPYDFHVHMKRYSRTRFELFENERDLLTAFLDKFANLDPDFVIGHELLGCDYETLVARMKVKGVPGWSQLGRFNRSEFPSTKTAFRYMFSGRIMCDIETSAKELIHARSYDLGELAHQVLGLRPIEYQHETVVDAFKTSEDLIKLLNATWDNTDLIFSILVELNVIPLAQKITHITGGVLSRTLSGGRSERNDYLLLHAFHEDNFICPERQVLKYQPKKGGKGDGDELAPTRRKAAYAGGLVLEPKAGYYDSCVLLMDFNSLYPSIIQEFNICFSTVKPPEQLADSDPNAEIIASVPDDSVEVGILPTQLKKLVEGRRNVKRKLAETNVPSQKILLDIEQKALKLTANSMYGCLGFEHCRFYAKHLASLVTFKGREILMSTKAMVENLGYEVIYGDTDSLMIDTKIFDYDEVINRGTIIKGEINRTFKLLEIDIDGVFKPLLLLKKKNYAGASIKKGPSGEIVRSIETKGLDTVRRDRAVIAKDAGERVLSMILAGDNDIAQTVEDIHNYLKNLGTSIANGEIPIEKFLISKQLNRNPEEYRETKGIGHVALALRHNQNPRNVKKLKMGHTVEYVVCLDGTDQSANQRAYTLQEVAETPEKLKLDIEYYLCQQIHPVMTRICDKLPITNAYVLAEMLGVEKSNLLHIKREETTITKRDQLLSRGESRFSSCKPFVIACPNCKLPNEIKERVRKNKDKGMELSMSRCAQCGIDYGRYDQQIARQVSREVSRLTSKLFNDKYVCENADCDQSSRNFFQPLTSDDNESPDAVTKAQIICRSCGSNLHAAEMTDRSMDQQLIYIKHLFDPSLEEFGKALEVKDSVLNLYNKCREEVDDALKHSFIYNIDQYSVFKMICSGTD